LFLMGGRSPFGNVRGDPFKKDKPKFHQLGPGF
jgi:hypothetical protein